jgi:hypothetical protein
VINSIQTKTVKIIMQDHFYNVIAVSDTQWNSLS